MKKTYHICLSSNKELMFRDREDYIRGINCLSLAVYKTEASLLAYSFMSNHVHIGVRCEDPKSLMKAFRYSYTRYYNSKYGRKGKLGERHYFQIEIEGFYHLLSTLAYILKNPLHHGITGTPFGYDFSSIDSLFRKDLKGETTVRAMSEKSQYLYLPRYNTLPPNYIMNEEGMIVPESVIDIADVEHYFSNARTFLYYMNRLSNKDWEKEQLRDENDRAPITLKEIEKGVPGYNINTMLRNENGKVNYNALSDIKLCYKIDKVILPKMKINSVYNLSPTSYNKLINILKKELYIPEEQLDRCIPKPKNFF